MNTTLLTFVFAAFILSAASAQIISNVPLKEVNAEYIRINSFGRPGNKVAIYIDFGQANEPFNTKDNLLLRQDLKPMEFNSIIDAFNFLATYGYELIETFVVPSESTGYPYHILRRKKSK